MAAGSEEGDPQEVSPSGGLYCYFRDKLEPPSNPSLTIAPSNWVSTQADTTGGEPHKPPAGLQQGRGT